MTAPASRRSFPRGLTTLPLIGGGVTLIGTPTAVAEPVTTSLLRAYSEWLFMERRLLCMELYPGLKGLNAESIVPANTGAGGFHFNDVGNGRYDRPDRQPSSRAALVLSPVGCDWREGAL